MKKRKYRKLDKAGFTLTEILAVIIIMVVVLMVAIPSIGKMLKGVTKNEKEKTVQILKNAASMYLQERKEETKAIYDGEKGFTVITVLDLIDEQFLNENILENEGIKKTTSIKASLDKDKVITYSVDEEGEAYIAFDSDLTLEYQESITLEKQLNNVRAYDKTGKKINITEEYYNEGNIEISIWDEKNSNIPGDYNLTYTIKYLDTSCKNELDEYIQCFEETNGQPITNTITAIRNVTVKPSKFDIMKITTPEDVIEVEYNTPKTNINFYEGVKLTLRNGSVIASDSDKILAVNNEYNPKSAIQTTINYSLKNKNSDGIIVSAERKISVKPNPYDIMQFSFNKNPLVLTLNSPINYYSGVTVKYRNGSTASLKSNMGVEISNQITNTLSEIEKIATYKFTRSDGGITTKNRTVKVTTNLADNINITANCTNSIDGCWFIGATADNYIKFDSDGNNTVNSSDKVWRIMRVTTDEKVQVILDTPFKESKYSEDQNCCNSGCSGKEGRRLTSSISSNLLYNLSETSIKKYAQNYAWCDGYNGYSPYSPYNYINNECFYKTTTITGLIRKSEYEKIANNNYSNNWLKLSSKVWWTMTGYGGRTKKNNSHYSYHNIWGINKYGELFEGNFSTLYYVRPVIYLDSTNKITGGNGTSSNPYIVKVK